MLLVKRRIWLTLNILISDECLVEFFPSQALFALQGPASAEVMTQLVPTLRALTFMQATECDIAGVHCFTTRSGYTGEGGFEILLPAPVPR